MHVGPLTPEGRELAWKAARTHRSGSFLFGQNCRSKMSALGGKRTRSGRTSPTCRAREIALPICCAQRAAVGVDGFMMTIDTPETGSGPDESHVDRAMLGPTPDNPSLSLKKRLKRAAFFDQREREVAAGDAVHV